MSRHKPKKQQSVEPIVIVTEAPKQPFRTAMHSPEDVPRTRRAQKLIPELPPISWNDYYE